MNERGRLHETQALGDFRRGQVHIDGHDGRARKHDGRMGDDPLVRVLAQDSDLLTRGMHPNQTRDKVDVIRELSPGDRQGPVSRRNEKRRRIRCLRAELLKRFKQHSTSIISNFVL